jgi:hypothetical protein
MTASTTRLQTRSNIPWYMWARTNSKELFCLSLWLVGIALVASGVRKALSTDILDFSNKRRKYETLSKGWCCKESSVSFLSTVLRVLASSEARNEILSCLAREEPRNKACGMTVAPRIPTARETVVWVKLLCWAEGCQPRTCIDPSRRNYFFRGNITPKSIFPVHMHLCDDDDHADEDCKNL